MLKRYLDEQAGMPAQDVITDVGTMHNLAEERLGYPTQKPVALLERIISASSNSSDVILDPICGSGWGTTVHAAEKLARQWIGIDIKGASNCRRPTISDCSRLTTIRADNGSGRTRSARAAPARG